MKITKSFATICFDKITNLILQGTLKPGEKLKGEYLKQELRTGLSPIREALFKLINTGLVEFKDNAGFNVTTLSKEKVQDIFKSHAKIECLLLRDSIENADDIWESKIIASLYTLAKIERTKHAIDYNLWSPKNEEFHNTLISGCKLNTLIEMRDKCLQMKEWCINLSLKNAKTTILVDHTEHALIAELAINKKTELCCSKLYQHLTMGIDITIQNLRQNNFF